MTEREDNDRNSLDVILNTHARSLRRSIAPAVVCVCGWRGNSQTHRFHVTDAIVAAGFRRHLPRED